MLKVFRSINIQSYIKNDRIISCYLLLTIFTLLISVISMILSVFSPIATITISAWSTASILFMMYVIWKYCIRAKNPEIKITKTDIFIFIIVSILVSAFYTHYALMEKAVYAWDTGVYWDISNSIYDSANYSMSRTEWSFIQSVWFDEYNAFPTLFIGIIYNFSDHSRFAYQMSVLILIVIPVLFYMFLTIKALFYKLNSISKLTQLAVITLFITPLLHQPTLIGYIDIVGFLFILPIFLVMSAYGFSFTLKPAIIIVLNLFLLFISRRFYLFWIVSFFVCIFMVNFFVFICEKNKKSFIEKFKNIINIGLALVLVSIVFVLPLIVIRIKYNFSSAYSAYDNGGLLLQFAHLFKWLGIVPSFLALIGIITMLYDKKQRPFSFFFILQIVTTCALFSTIQTMDPHHMYTVLPSCLFLMAFGMVNIIKILKYKTLGVAVYIIVFALNAVNSYAHVLGSSYVFSNISITPQVRQDFDLLFSMADYMQEKHKETDGQFYIFASTADYNEQIFIRLYMPSTAMSDVVLENSDIDLRDGFPIQFLTCRYVVITDPLLYLYKPEYQRTIWALGDMVVHHPQISKHYKIIKTYKYNEISFKIFELIEPFSKSDIDIFISEFSKYYPDYQDLFENRLNEYKLAAATFNHTMR